MPSKNEFIYLTKQLYLIRYIMYVTMFLLDHASTKIGFEKYYECIYMCDTM